MLEAVMITAASSWTLLRGPISADCRSHTRHLLPRYITVHTDRAWTFCRGGRRPSSHERMEVGAPPDFLKISGSPLQVQM